MMKVIIRADASIQIGMGHVMRCLTLARYLRESGHVVVFLCKVLNGDLIELIRDAGFEVFVTRDDVDHSIKYFNENMFDWLIVDHYLLDSKWHQLARPFVKKIMVMDDLANRSHDCDLLLDPTPFLKLSGRYERLIPKDARTLLGPEFAIVRPEFWKKTPSHKRDKRRVLICFGGMDPTGETLKVLAALSKSELFLDVVVGKGNPLKEKILSLCEQMPLATCHIQPKDMSAAMGRAEISIGAAGSMSFERCCVGLPSLTIEIAYNQRDLAHQFDRLGAAKHLGVSGQVTHHKIEKAVMALLANKKKLEDMSLRAKQLVDGKGLSRVASALVVGQ